MKYHYSSYLTHSHTHIYTYANSFLASKSGVLPAPRYLLWHLVQFMLKFLAAERLDRKTVRQSVRERERGIEWEIEREREYEEKRNAAKTFKCGTLFINVERSIWGGNEAGRVQGWDWWGEGRQVPAGLGKLAKREQFVISLLDVAEIFKIN